MRCCLQIKDTKLNAIHNEYRFDNWEFEDGRYVFYLTEI